jgi:hypothetical protein
MMSPAIHNPASCKSYAVICFLHAKNISSTEIYRELCAVYGQIIMSEIIVGQWCAVFKDGRKIVGRPSILSDDLVQCVGQKVCERRRFTISEFSFDVPLFSKRLSQSRL